MADLPAIPDSIPSVTAPRPSVPLPTPRVYTPQAETPRIAEFPSPYRDLASALDKAGETLGKVAVPFAERAGLEAVGTDDQGNVRVTPAPIVGDAAIAFSRAVKFSALAQAEGEARRHDLLLRRQFPEDPGSYLAAAQAFKNEYVSKYTKAVGPEVGVSLGKTIDSMITQGFNWSLYQQQAKVRRDFDHNTQAGIKDATTDLINLIESGGEGTPAAQALLTKVIALHHERVSNQVLGAPAEETNMELKALDRSIGAARFTATINQMLKDPEGGPAKAMEAVDRMVNDQSVDPTQRVANHGEAIRAINQFTQDNNRRTAMAGAQQKARDSAAEDAIIRDRASDNPTVTEADIKKSDMSPESKMRMLSWIKRDGIPEPLSQVSQVTAMDLFRRMNLPDGDPAKITDLGPIRSAYAPADGGKGKLTRADEEWLEKRFIEARSPEGSRLNQIRQQFSHAVAPSIDKSNPIQGKIFSGDKMRSYAFERFVDQKVEDYRKTGKDPFDLFNPTKPDYLGKPEVIAPFQRSMQESMQEVERMLVRPPSAPPAAAQRQPGETPAEYLRRTGAQ